MTQTQPRTEPVAGVARAASSSPDAARPGVAGSLIRKVDLCRGLFAFLVVAAHAYDACWVAHPDQMAAMPWGVRHVLGFTLQAGFYWVMGFFVISGYCIQLSVGRLIESGRFPLGVYLAARLTRIIPLYYAGLLFAVAVEAAVASDRPAFYPDGVDRVGFLAQLVFAQRWVRTFGSFAPSWTITNEMFYYLFFGALALCAAGRRSRPAWLGLGLCVGIAAAMQCLYATGSRGWLVLNVGLMFGLGINWFLGALVAAHGRSMVGHRSARVAAAAWPAVFAAAVGLRGSGRCPEQMIFLVLGIAFALMLLRFTAVAEAEAASPGPRPERGERSSAIAEVVGLASYPTYLFHAPVLLLWAAAAREWGLFADWRLTWAAMVGSGIGLGVALGWLAERPIMAWRAGLLDRLKRRASSSSSTMAIPAAALGVARRPEGA